MSENDRKKVFWYLKRKTSYTAWARAAAAFDDFSLIFKKQVVEEPRAPGPFFAPYEWDVQYIDILKAQVWFEQGLEVLRKGDRSVWLYNGRGVLRDALMTGSYWFTELIYGGERCDHEYFGKYLDELKTSIRKFSKAQDDVGYIQSMMIDTPAPEFWGEWLECVLNSEVYPRNPDPGFPQAKYGSPLVYPHPLPDVPAAARDLTIRTGEPVPTDGIYEPQVKDGCMNYLLKDTDAPSLAEESGLSRPVAWKLIWEDIRYIDGHIPVEERSYFVSEHTPEVVQTMIGFDVVSKLSGEVCPLDGFWAVMDEIDTKQTIRRGAKMPQSRERDVTWVWVRK